MNIASLHYISQSLNGKSHAEQVQEACEAGVKWVQLRMKNVTDDQLLEEAKKVKTICSNFGATFILNDHVEIAKEVGVDGVHLGKKDMRPNLARKILGSGFIIGSTANTFEDIENLLMQGVDYIGLGPYRFTPTKENLSPILGEQGYTEIIERLKRRNINIPVIAIGGIRVEDIGKLLQAGVYGVAIASLINEAVDKRDIVENIRKALNYGEITYSRSRI